MAVGRSTMPASQPTPIVSPSRKARDLSAPDVDARPRHLDGRFLPRRAVAAREGMGPDPRHGGRQPHGGARRIDRDRPLGPRHVPVQLVVCFDDAFLALALVRFVEPETLAHLVGELDRADRVLGVRDPDPDAEMAAVAIDLVPKRIPRLVRHRLHGEPEAVSQPEPAILERESAENPVVAALEARADRLGHLDRAALQHADVGVKTRQPPGTAVLRGRGSGKGAGEADERGRHAARDPRARRAASPAVPHEKLTRGPSR